MGDVGFKFYLGYQVEFFQQEKPTRDDQRIIGTVIERSEFLCDEWENVYHKYLIHWWNEKDETQTVWRDSDELEDYEYTGN